MSEYQFVTEPFSLDTVSGGSAFRNSHSVGWFFYPDDDYCVVTFETYASPITEVAKRVNGDGQWVICEWALKMGPQTALMLDLIPELGSRYREYLALKSWADNE